MKKINTIELFAGCGGLIDGFERTGYYNLLAAVEWLKPQCNTLISRLENKYGEVNASSKVLNFVKPVIFLLYMFCRIKKNAYLWCEINNQKLKFL